MFNFGESLEKDFVNKLSITTSDIKAQEKKTQSMIESKFNPIEWVKEQISNGLATIESSIYQKLV